MRPPKEAQLLFVPFMMLLSVLLMGGAGVAQERVFVVQGEDGSDCTDSVLECDDSGGCELAGSLDLEGDLSVAGDLSVDETGRFDELVVENLIVRDTVSSTPDCPRGYELDDTVEDIIVCFRQSDVGHRDEMVKVGDVWIDRYESSIWANPDCSGTQYGGEVVNWGDVIAAFPRHGGFSAPLYACSVAGVTATRFMTSLQVEAACAASGKRFITDAEWQAAAAGTVDPGASGAMTGPCFTDGRDWRETGNAGDVPGGADSCISYWGVEDMIGNMWEITSDWWGQGRDDADGAQPPNWFGDGYWNIDPAEEQGRIEDDWTVLPTVNYRSGNTTWTREFDGVWVMVQRYSASHENGGMSFRCAIGW